jgi:uncharacterized phiE125 gp8 family phage protein
MFRLTETSPPGAEPVTLDEAKAQLREASDAEDALILSLIAASRLTCERYTGRAFIMRTLSLFLDAWPDDGCVTLPCPPLVAVSSIQVYADDDSATSFPASSYFADLAGGRVALRTNALPPLPLRAANGIEICYRAGYGAAPSDVPAPLRQGVLRMTAHLYQHRGDGLGVSAGLETPAVSGAASLLRPYRVMGL